jgi:hypothetical protein
VSPVRVGATGFGEQRPAVPNDSDAHRAQNRRVEIVVLAAATDKSSTQTTTVTSTQSGSGSSHG